jgi:hypothetical protein
MKKVELVYWEIRNHQESYAKPGGKVEHVANVATERMAREICSSESGFAHTRHSISVTIAETQEEFDLARLDFVRTRALLKLTTEEKEALGLCTSNVGWKQ